MGETTHAWLNILNTRKQPSALSGKGELSRNWCKWRQEFLAFMKQEDPKESYKDSWGKYLQLFIGSIGKEAFKTFKFDKTADKENFDILLKKFDLHFIYGCRSRQRNESIDEYVNNLMHIAIASNYIEFQDLVKVKVIEDLKCTTFTGSAQAFLHSLGDNLELHLQPLTLNKIISIWKRCDKLMLDNNGNQLATKANAASNQEVSGCTCKFQQPQNHDKQCSRCKRYDRAAEGCTAAQSARGPQKTKTNPVDSYPEQINGPINDVAMECIRCGTQHPRNKCPAHGKQCSNCKKYNHLAEKCTVQFIRNCPKCGTDHVQSRCIAYGKICSKCGKSNHFWQKCRVPDVKDCPRCGTDHIMSACPAQGKLCSRCNKPNHLKEKCITKLNVD